MMPLLFLPPFRTEVKRGRMWRNKSVEKRRQAPTAGRAGRGGSRKERVPERRSRKAPAMLSSVVFGGTPLSL